MAKEHTVDGEFTEDEKEYQYELWQAQYGAPNLTTFKEGWVRPIAWPADENGNPIGLRDIIKVIRSKDLEVLCWCGEQVKVNTFPDDANSLHAGQTIACCRYKPFCTYWSNLGELLQNRGPTFLLEKYKFYPKKRPAPRFPPSGPTSTRTQKVQTKKETKTTVEVKSEPAGTGSVRRARKSTSLQRAASSSAGLSSSAIPRGPAPPVKNTRSYPGFTELKLESAKDRKPVPKKKNIDIIDLTVPARTCFRCDSMVYEGESHDCIKCTDCKEFVDPKDSDHVCIL